MLKNWLIFSLIFVLLLQPGLLFAEDQNPASPIAPPTEVIKSKNVIGFADSLFNQGDYYEAHLWYRYHLYLYPKTPNRDAIYLRIGECFQRGRQWEDAEYTFGQIIQEFPKSPLAAEASYRIGQGYFLSGDYTKAIISFDDTMSEYSKTKFKSDAMYAKGLALINKGEWDSASSEFAKLIDEQSGSDLVGQAKVMQEMAQEGKELPRKSPLLAAALSAMLPGLGKVYTHYYIPAALAFVINGAVAFLAYDSFAHDRIPAGVIFCTLGAATYSANVFGGWYAARRYNKKLENEYETRVMQEGYVPRLGLSIDF